jgi:cell wall-associated NlpC family hydrolase
MTGLVQRALIVIASAALGTCVITGVASAEMIRGSSGSGAAATAARIDNRALNWAETQRGKWYEWGGTGPNGYDCSGLVMVAFEHAGIQLPRTTYEMLSSRHLVRTWRPARGDLAFYGSGHVEFVTVWRDETFGAHDSGSPVNWITWNEWWHPTMFFRVVP